MHPAIASRRHRVRSDLVRHRGHLRAGARAAWGCGAALCRDREVRTEGRAFLLLPDPDGALSGVLFGLETANRPDKDRFLPGRLPGLLPAGTYRFANAPHDTRLAALAFALGSYRFTRYRKADAERREARDARRRRRRRCFRASPKAWRSRAT